VHKVQIATVVIALVLVYARFQPVILALRQHNALARAAST